MESPNETQFSEACREHLKENIQRKLKKIMADSLSYVELTYGVDPAYKTLRSKILGLINDQARSIETELLSYVIFKKVFSQEFPFTGKGE